MVFCFKVGRADIGEDGFADEASELGGGCSGEKGKEGF